MQGDMKKTFSVRLSDEQVNALTEHAEKIAAPIGYCVRIAIEEFLKARGYKAKHVTRKPPK
jgi:predicted transcriptional regulator